LSKPVKSPVQFGFHEADKVFLQVFVKLIKREVKEKVKFLKIVAITKTLGYYT